MKDRLMLLLYIASVLMLTSVHDLLFLSFFLLSLFLISGKNLLSLLRKSFISVVFFNFAVSISYIIFCLLKGQEWLSYVVLLNLRVFSLTFLTFLFVSKINFFKAVSFSKTLQYLLTISYSQITAYTKSFEDFRLSLKSRLIQRPDRKDVYTFISRVFSYFFKKSVENSKEISQAMRSRGFFID